MLATNIPDAFLMIMTGLSIDAGWLTAARDATIHLQAKERKNLLNLQQTGDLLQGNEWSSAESGVRGEGTPILLLLL